MAGAAMADPKQASSSARARACRRWRSSSTASASTSPAGQQVKDEVRWSTSSVISTSAAGRRSGGCGSNTRSPSRAASPPQLDMLAVGVIARPRHQVTLLAVCSSRILSCVRHKVEAAAPAAEPLEMEELLHGVRLDLACTPSGEPFSAAPS
jgi:hypothetical protein